MKQPSPTDNGFNPEKKQWENQEGKIRYHQQVSEYAMYISSNQPKN